VGLVAIDKKSHHAMGLDAAHIIFVELCAVRALVEPEEELWQPFFSACGKVI
jgi:hypothetical protein